MPRKNKKKQRKEERRRTMQRVRQEKAWQPPPDVEFLDDELTRDVLTLFPDLTGDPARGEAAAETLLIAALASDDLVDESEFRSLYFHPMHAIDVYAELEDERGVSEEMLDALSPEDEDILFFELLQDLAERMLTPQMQADILDAAEAAWQRLREAGDQEKAGRLAALLTLLRSEEGEEVWPQAGVVQGILRRSLEAGFEMARVFEADQAAETGPREWWQQGADRRVQQQLDTIIAKYPGLEAALARDDDEAWREGLEALMEGELYLGLFSDEELERASDLLSPERLGAPEATEEDMAHAGIQAVGTYLAGLLTLERRAEMRDQLLTLLEDADLAGEWSELLTSILHELEDEDPEPALVPLTAAIFGEMGDLADQQDDGVAEA